MQRLASWPFSIPAEIVGVHISEVCASLAPKYRTELECMSN